MSGAWWFLAGWCSASAAIALATAASWRLSRRCEFQTTTRFAVEQGWPETQE